MSADPAPVVPLTVPVADVLNDLTRLARVAEDDLVYQLCETVAGAETDVRLSTLGAGLAMLREARQRLQNAERTLEDAVAEVLAEHRRWHVDGIGTLEHKRGTIRKQWDSDALARKAVTAAMERGEVEHPHDVAELLLRVAGFGYWRVGKLRELGLDADEYCHSEPGRNTVVITADEQ